MTQKEHNDKLARLGMECFNSFYFFFRMFWPEMSGDKYIDAPHIKFICETIQAKAMPVIRGERCMETLIINVPPGSSKSTIATIAFPMWVWLRAPYLASTNVSYSASLSERHAQKARTITSSQKWKDLFDAIFEYKYGKPLRIIKENQAETINNFKGERFTASVDGNITGKHADFIIKDDMQNPKEAKSDTIREHANEWDAETLTSRHKNPSCYLDIIIAQRLHENDLCGYTLDKNIPISQICLPAEITNASKVVPASAVEIYQNGILDPNRRPKDVLEIIKESMKSAAYTCQYLQAPFNLDEQDIVPSMFEIVNSVNDNEAFDVWIDGAYTEKTENDPSGIDIIKRVGNDIIVKDSYDVRKKLPDLMAFLAELESTGVFDKHKSRVFIEPKASGYSLAQYIEHDTDYNFVLIGEHNKAAKKLISEGKKARHEIIKPKAESHRIKLLKGSWNDGFINQICGFPRAAHDEHVDTLGYAIQHYYMNESTFIANYAVDRLRNDITDSIRINIESYTEKYTIDTSYTENDKGDVQLFDYPHLTHKYRYICVLSLRAEDERGDSTTIMVYDRLTGLVCALFTSNSIIASKASNKALEMATMYADAKLVVVVKSESSTGNSEEGDMSHIALAKMREVRYDNLHFQYTNNNIKKSREREYGYLADQSARRELYHNLKETAEQNKIKSVPMEVFNQMITLERKKETGDVDTQEGLDNNSVLSYAVALKVDSVMYDDVIVRKIGGW